MVESRAITTRPSGPCVVWHWAARITCLRVLIAGERAATLYSLIKTAKLNCFDCQAYLRYVLTHLPEHPSRRVAELLPWHVAEHLVEPAAQAAA